MSKRILYLLPNHPTPHEQMELDWLNDNPHLLRGFVLFDDKTYKNIRHESEFRLASYNPSTLKLFFRLTTYLLKNIKLASKLSPSEFRPAISYLKVAIRRGIALSKIVAECEDCIVYTFWLFDPIPIEIVKSYHPKTVCVSRAHGGDIYLHSQYIGQNHISIWRTQSLKHFNLILSVSEEGARYLRHTHGLSNVQTLRLGSRTPSITSRSTNQEREHLTVVSVSNIIPLKRIPLIAKIMSLTTRRVIWHHFGEARTQEYSEFVLSEVDSILKDSNTSICWHGKKDVSEILQFHLTEKPDLFISCSESEGIPVSVMEAMSCAIPIVATDAGGTHELIDGNGVLLDLHVSPESVGTIIEEWGREPVALEALRNRSYELWREKWSFEQNQKQFVQILEQISQQNKSPRE